MDEIHIGDVSTIVIGRGILSAETLLGARERAPGMVAAFTQPGAARAARTLVRELRRAGIRAELRVLPDGEAAKDLAVAAEAYRWLAEVGVERSDLVVGIGGGSVTDLAGFVAATWLRGVEVIHVPTTLLGAVDAAVGGKTGVDLDGKNLVGAFHHPSRVVADVDVLDRLPADLLREGLAEALKCGLIADADLLSLLESDGVAADLAEVVRRAVAVKASVVERDFRERGERAILNYGHTIGHAVEAASGLRHGPAVAVGMIAAGRASALVHGFPDEGRQRDAALRLDLPVEAPPVDAAAVRALITLDKKRVGSRIHMVLLAAIADPRVGPVEAATVDAALAVIGIS